MNDYSIALFLHIVGVLGLFVAPGLEWSGLRQIRSAMIPEQARGWMGILKSVRRVGFVSMLTTVITGFYMMATIWGGVAWIYVSLGALVLVIALSVVLTGPRMAAIGQALATEKGPLSKTFHSLANQPFLWVSIQTRIAIALGIVLLKATKPGSGGSLLITGVAILLGQHEQAADAQGDVQVGRHAREQNGDHQHVDEQENDPGAGDAPGEVKEDRHTEPVEPDLQHD